jgi:restriction system protein
MRLLTRKQRRIIKKSNSILFEIANIICSILKGIGYAINQAKKVLKNYKIAKEIGYDYTQILTKVRKLSPRQFEVFCAELLRQSYRNVRLTPPSNDYGRDIICNDDDGNLIFVECKHYGKKSFVGREICSKLIGSMAILGADKGIIINTGKYHSNAYEVISRVDNLELLDEDDLFQLIINTDAHRMSQIMMKTSNNVS